MPEIFFHPSGFYYVFSTDEGYSLFEHESYDECVDFIVNQSPL